MSREHACKVTYGQNESIQPDERRERGTDATGLALANTGVRGEGGEGG